MIVITIVGWFINLDAISMVMNYIMIGIFLGLTAYDMQKMSCLLYTSRKEKPGFSNRRITNASAPELRH